MAIYMDIMPYFIKAVYIYVFNESIFWYSLKNRTPQNFTIIANLGTKFLNSGQDPAEDFLNCHFSS